MQPLEPIEPSRLLEKKSNLNARKISFEINRLELPNGSEGEFGIVLHPGASLAVPITNEGKIVLIRQYRFAISRRILEFPAGTLEEGEDPLTSMKRELGEEAGYEANKWESLGKMIPCPGYSNELIHLFLARDLKELVNKPMGDEDEDIEVVEMTKKELDFAISSGTELLDGKTITALYRASQFINL